MYGNPYNYVEKRTEVLEQTVSPGKQNIKAQTQKVYWMDTRDGEKCLIVNLPEVHFQMHLHTHTSACVCVKAFPPRYISPGCSHHKNKYFPLFKLVDYERTTLSLLSNVSLLINT